MQIQSTGSAVFATLLFTATLGGCVPFRPPADDQVAWKHQQKQDTKRAAEESWPGWEWVAWFAGLWPGYAPDLMVGY